MEEKKTLTQLAGYYMERYGIEENSTNTIRHALRQKINRLLHNVSYGKMTLYDAIKKDNSVREISIAEFEQYCFAEWATFLTGDTKNGVDYVTVDNNMLVTDLKRHKIDLEEEKKWRDIAKATNEEIRREHETGAINEGHIDYDMAEAIRATAYCMMIEAIYSMYFEPFNWNKLSNDILLNERYDTSYHANNPPEVIRAHYNLKDRNNYIGKRKDK